jgi:asparagine synthase (glutamine-hydrolysing)
MCGIAGIWNYKSGRPAERERLQAITQDLAHRGPDGDGYYFGPGPGLGHRRLSIIDLAGGRQPMSNEDGTVWITFNGEIYNFPELRTELLRRGHVFRTNSDTEAIVHLYEDYGEGCFEKLRGMFALAIWDDRRQRLVLARDRIGIKPLFYGLGEEGIVFGSELKCVVNSGKVALDIDPAALADLFTFFYIPSPKTIYRNAYSLEPSHYLVVTREGVSKGRYWDLSGEVLRLPNEQDYEEQLYTGLRDSVQCHLLSDVPVGAFLSGGVDSSAVVALMAGLVPHPVMTCSIGFQDREFNELPRARTVAQAFHTDHHEQVVASEPAKVLAELVHYYDQPFPDHSSIPTYYVSRLARERVKVVLSGDGGDENFGGYSRYRRHLFLKKLRRFVPSALQSALQKPLHSWEGARDSHTLPHRLARVFQQLLLGCREGYLDAMTITSRSLRARLLGPELERELRGYDPLDSFRRIYDNAPFTDPLSKIFYLDLKTYLVDDILTKVDRASMANSLEVRVPLLDYKVVEFAHSLPLHLKIRNGQGKYLLRKVAARHLPAAHLALQKKGFRVPMASWMRGELRDWVREAILPASNNLLDRAGVQQTWDQFQRGDSRLMEVLSIALSVGLYCQGQKTLLTRPSEVVAVQG